MMDLTILQEMLRQSEERNKQLEVSISKALQEIGGIIAALQGQIIEVEDRMTSLERDWDQEISRLSNESIESTQRGDIEL